MSVEIVEWLDACHDAGPIFNRCGCSPWGCRVNDGGLRPYDVYLTSHSFSVAGYDMETEAL